MPSRKSVGSLSRSLWIGRTPKSARSSSKCLHAESATGLHLNPYTCLRTPVLTNAIIVDSDRTVQYGGFGMKFPRVPGHEICGEVVSVPDGEKTWKVGQIVGSGWHGGHDGTCTSCRRGDYITCAHPEINGRDELLFVSLSILMTAMQASIVMGGTRNT
jgi:hypothetical protein